MYATITCMKVLCVYYVSVTVCVWTEYVVVAAFACGAGKQAFEPADVAGVQWHVRKHNDGACIVYEYACVCV